MTTAALNVYVDDNGTIWLDARSYLKSLAEVRDAVAEMTPGQQLDSFGGIDKWLTAFLDNLAESLDGIDTETVK